MQLPLDQAWVVMQLLPATEAKWSDNEAVSTTAENHSFTSSETRLIELNVTWANVFLRWWTSTAATTSSFDRMVMAWQTKVFAVPEWVENISIISDWSATVYIVEL